MTDAQARRLVRRLVAAYPGQAVTEDTVTEYVEALKPHGWDAGERAVQRVLQERAWWPSIHDVTRHARELAPDSSAAKMAADIRRDSRKVVELRACSFPDAVRLARRQFETNLLDSIDSPDEDAWRDRVAACDSILEA